MIGHPVFVWHVNPAFSLRQFEYVNGHGSLVREIEDQGFLPNSVWVSEAPTDRLGQLFLVGIGHTT